MSWTTPNDVKAQVQRLWDRGVLLAVLAGGDDCFPYRLTLKGPGSRELSERFTEVRDWIDRLARAAGPYRIVWRTVNHRILGSNDVPKQIWIDRLEDALALIGQARSGQRFAAQVALTRDQQPELLRWLRRRPLRALRLADAWPRLLAVVDWMRRHPRPNLYLRQVDLPDIHSKFIEQHRGVLAELFDMVLPEESIDKEHSGVGGFCCRFGFRDKPLRIRFRVLDSKVQLLPVGTDQDITLTQTAFASLNLPIAHVFITENEVNFLAFPDISNAIVIFGAGYGFENLAVASWLHEKNIYYWGDIDTHGFAILNQLRSFFPTTLSLLMDQRTLLKHRSLWGVEEQQKTRELSHLTPEEYILYDQLRQQHWGEGVRLEQERIGFHWLQDALHDLV